MADPTTKTFNQIVSQQVAAVQAYASGLIDASVGSVVRAITQAVAGVVMWLQALGLYVLRITRLSTSTGEDVDSFIADFAGPYVPGGDARLSRLGAMGSTGDVTFGRLSNTGTATVPVGATVSTQDGTQRFVVLTDTDNPAWDAGQNGFVIGVGQFTVTVAVQALGAGLATNVLAESINTITAPITGVDTVSNAADFVNGIDTESDDAYRLRFRAYIAGLREGTPAAIKSYVEALMTGVQAIVVENENINGTPHKGFFYVVVDDGTGTPTSEILDAAESAVDDHRAAGVEFAVIAPTVTTVNVAFAVVSSLVSSAPDISAAQAAVRLYLNSLPLQAGLIYDRLFQVAYNASPTILNINSLLVNGATADIAGSKTGVLKAGTVVVT